MAAGDGSHYYACDLDWAVGAIPTASGQLCFDSITNCSRAPNACSNDSPCAADVSSCQTGAAAFSAHSHHVVCSLAEPELAFANGAGALCFVSAAACEGAPNACSGRTLPCVRDLKACSTGRAASQAGAVWSCPADVPPGALPNAAGRYCYDVLANCEAGASACGTGGDACVFNAFQCSMGFAGTGSHAYVCPSDKPLGSVFSFSSGGVCYDTAVSCLTGPNACDSSSVATTCVSTADVPALHGLCPLSSPYLCPADFPSGASATASGVCYDGVQSCVGGPNACTDAAPCVASPVCPAGAPFTCRRASAPKMREFVVSAQVQLVAATDPLASGSNTTAAAQPRALAIYAASAAASVLSRSQRVVDQLSVLLSVPASTIVVASVTDVPAPTDAVLLAFTVSIATADAANALSATITSAVSATSPRAQHLLATALGWPQLSPVTLAASPIVTPPAVTPPPQNWVDLAAAISQGMEPVLTIAQDLVVGEQPIIIGPGIVLTLRAACPANPDGRCVIDGQGRSNFFLVSSDAVLTLQNLALRNGACADSSCLSFATGGGGSLWGGAESALVRRLPAL